SPRDRETLDRLLAAAGAGRVLIRGATVISMDPAVGDLPRGDILIEGSRIEAIGSDLGAAASQGQAVVVEAAGCIAIPGLVDAHRHCWQTQMRRLLADAGIAEYNDFFHFQLGPVYRPEDMYLGTKLAALGAVDSGVTCVLDFSHNMRTPAYSDSVVEAWKDSGLRSVVASCPPLGGEWDQSWRRDFARVREEHFPSDDGLVTLRMAFMARAIPEIQGDVCLSVEGIREARELGIGVTVDGVIGPEVSAHIKELGGALGPDVTWIHCGDLDREAWKILVETGGKVVLAVTSDQQLAIAGSIAPIQDVLDAGLRPGLSVDVECSLTTDMFTQMQVVLNVQRMLAGNRAAAGEEEAPAPISVRDALEFATIASAKANGVWDRCGSLTPGKEADLVLIDAEAINNFPLNNAIATVVLGSDARNVDTVFVAGRPMKWGGGLLAGDDAALRRQVVESRDRLLGEIGRGLDVTGPAVSGFEVAGLAPDGKR
ncbi:MAG TPA: amidohydrolase family protein, partial [Solirubrobacterales bacterium]|nr:amidohydrolase family protein [Solirubrobacterales bacterium]